MKGMPRLKLVYGWWLMKNPMMTSLILDEMPSLVGVGCHFAASNTSLTHVRVADCPRFEGFDPTAFKHCPLLNSVELHKLPRLEFLGCDYQMGGGLVTWELSGLPGLKTIGDGCLLQAMKLRKVIIDGLPQLEEIHNNFLSGSSVVDLRVRNLPKLALVGAGALSNCKSLTGAHFSNLPALARVANRWLAGCTSLTQIEFAGLPNLARIGDGFCTGSGLPRMDSIYCDHECNQILREVCTSAVRVVVFEDGVNATEME